MAGGPAMLGIDKEDAGEGDAGRGRALLPGASAIGRGEDVTALADDDQVIVDRLPVEEQRPVGQRCHLGIGGQQRTGTGQQGRGHKEKQVLTNEANHR